MISSGSLIYLPALEQTHVLWDNGLGTAALWRIGPSGETTKRQFGPFPGWAARALDVGMDGAAQVLWAGRDGAASLWSIAEDGESRHVEFGPYAGWEARAVAAGPDGTHHVLWRGADGAAIVWSLRPGQSPGSRSFGPYAGWGASSLSVGMDNRVHLLWHGRDGQAGVWRWSEGSGRDGEAEIESQIESQISYGPHDGWSAVAVAEGEAGRSRLLWQGEGGQASLWPIEEAGETGEGETGGEERPQTVYGPFAGWTVIGAACGPGDGARLLWKYDLGGMASLWRLAADGGFTHEEYGPYSGWVPVALAAGP